MKCFVTGATGHIGNVLVRELHDHHYDVTSLVLPNDNYKMIEPYSSIVFGNILDADQMRELIQGYDLVFHLAGMVEIGTGRKKKLMQVNVEGSKNVANACVVNKIPRLIYTSSVHAIPELPKGVTQTEVTEFDPKKIRGLYGKSKAIATDYILGRKDSGTEIIVVHPSGVIGPYDYQLSNVSQLFVDFLMGRLSAYLKGGYNFVDVRDVAQGIRLAAEKGRNGECYILSGQEITVKELLDAIAIETGRKKIKTKLAYWFILAMSYFAEVFYKLAGRKPLFTHYSVIVLNSNYAFSNEKACKELGFTVRDLKHSIHDTIRFAKENFVEKQGKRYIRRTSKI
ncbi:MAG: NAD-dependent epimerase/dehydratase family protein [Candidatus Izemoplasmatales bacterium]|nr:NAD-dependent epimerase/dehydratase family protein [Candidatus Izemoplasmatales bacterium]